MPGSIKLMVVPHHDSVEVFAPGQLTPGTVVVDASFIEVAGPEPVSPPIGRLTLQEYQDWLSSLRKRGFSLLPCE